MEKTYCE